MNPSKLVKQNPFVLAPMDNVTDIAFRELCEEKGCSYSVSELTSVDALIRDKVPLSRYQKGNLRHNSVQLFGNDSEKFIEASKKIEEQADSIDVNFGCPSPSVNSNNSGAILLKDPQNVEKIVDKLVKHSQKPITAKIRLGYNKTTYKEIAKKIENSCADLITVHGRTAKQGYSGNADWDAIKEVFENSKITVLGNGDIKYKYQIDKYLNSHCHGFMIGRGAIGNPNIFKEFTEEFNYKYLKKNSEKFTNHNNINYMNNTQIDQKLANEDEGNINNSRYESIKQQQKKLFFRYISKLENYEFNKRKNSIQLQSMWFFKGIDGVRELRRKIMQARREEEIIDLIRDF